MCPCARCPGAPFSSACGMLMYLVDVSVSASESAAVAAGSMLPRFVSLACFLFVRNTHGLEGLGVQNIVLNYFWAMKATRNHFYLDLNEFHFTNPMSNIFILDPLL